jgi:hydroxymethylglutaryl-CoA lyase
MLDAVLERLPATRLAGHFHDTRGLALQNIALCVGLGLRTFDSSVGGLGGCPYAPGAQGNVATEAVVAMLHNRGFETGIDVEALAEMSRFAQDLRRPL